MPDSGVELPREFRTNWVLRWRKGRFQRILAAHIVKLKSFTQKRSAIFKPLNSHVGTHQAATAGTHQGQGGYLSHRPAPTSSYCRVGAGCWSKQGTQLAALGLTSQKRRM